MTVHELHQGHYSLEELGHIADKRPTVALSGSSTGRLR